MKLNHALVLTSALLLTPLLRAADLPAPLPEFMDQQQMAQWNANKSAAAPTAATSNEGSTQFYTGKPYVADAGGYIFKYRTYDPGTGRWTSADPSGFPDGVNNRLYAASPTTELDPDGLSLTFADGSSGTPSPGTASDTTSNGTKFTSTAFTMTIVPITSNNQGSITSSLQSQYGNNLNFSTGTANAVVTVNGYYAEANANSPAGDIGGLHIDLSVGAGFDFTQSISSNQVSGSNKKNVSYPDVHPTNSAITRYTQPDGTVVGDTGGGNFIDDPYRQFVPGQTVNWKGTLYVEQISGNNYTVIGEIKYSFNIE